MSGKLPIPVVVLAAMVATLYLISSMGLFSSIIAWISLEFVVDYAGPLAFVIGTLSLAAAIVAILMVGISRLRQALLLLFVILAVITVLASLGLGVLFGLYYIGDEDDFIGGDICDDCEQLGMETQECVDSCNDECCFTDMSGPLAIVFLAFTATALIASILGLIIAVYQTCTSGGKQR